MLSYLNDKLCPVRNSMFVTALYVVYDVTRRTICYFSEVVRPDNFDVANAIGAAISQVSGSIDGVFDVVTKGRETVIEEVKEAARQEALRAGADADSLEIVDLEEIPLAYLPSNAVRFKVKAVGNLKR